MNPVIAIDVSKPKSVAAIFSDRNVCVKKPFVFNHSVSELDQIDLWLNTFKQQHGIQPTVVMEATGNYSKPLTAYFYDHGYDIFVLNPLTTSQIKSKSLRKIKTDPVDTMRIATVFYNQKLKPYVPDETVYANLKFLARQYNGFNTTYQELVVRLHAVVDLVYPDFNKMFSSVRSKTALNFLKAYPTPHLIRTASLEELSLAFHSAKKSSEWHLNKANLIKRTVEESLYTPSAQQPILAYYVDLILHMQQTLDDIRAQMRDLAKLSPCYKLLLSIPGVGEVTASVILSEIGDIHRFHSKKQLTAYAGLDPAVFQSGKYTAKNNKISKRGSPYLRKALYQAVCAGISKRSNGYANKELRAFYDKLLESGKPSRVALTACSAKLLRIIFGILSSETEFRY
ncbi:IS110 family RNA-guided transposase [Fusibacter ferrireducens]|uniref:IS110 family transposase n=1 Tax=Fusibacter ferrireducens TaxID=2785058 RepID=A0ABR9ZLX5_9FIRM|nr:IS110 family transposase [Fusibacter ferrireducens]MBF4691482.1 IS110 family transposase [Fusibacter ferrireducens]